MKTSLRGLSHCLFCCLFLCLFLKEGWTDEPLPESTELAEVKAQFVSQNEARPPVSVYVAGTGIALSPSSDVELGALQAQAPALTHQMMVVVQDKQGQVNQYQFVFPQSEVDKLTHGGMLVVSLADIPSLDVLGLHVEVISGFPGLSILQPGMSLKDVTASLEPGVIFGFGVLRQ